MQTVWNWLLQRAIWSPTSWFGALTYLVIVLALATMLSWVFRRLARSALQRDTHGIMDRTAAYFLIQLGQFLIFAVMLIGYAHIVPALRALGTAMLTGVSISAVVIGLAAQNTLSNLVAGFSLLLYRPFHVGDRIQVNAPTGLETGTVENLTLGYTVLQTFDNRRIVVPNSVMASQITVNLTAVNPRVMAVVPIGIGYSADIEKARAVLMELAQNHPLVEEVVTCPVIQLGNSSVVLSLRVWCANAGDAKQVEYDLYEQAKVRFDLDGIEIPFPYTNVILHKE